MNYKNGTMPKKVKNYYKRKRQYAERLAMYLSNDLGMLSSKNSNNIEYQFQYKAH